MAVIDIHSHVLPFVDDGSDSIASSLVMLKEAINNHVTDIIATPHYCPKRGYDNPVNVIKESFDLLQSEIKKRELPIRVKLGMEIYCSEYDNIISKLDNGELLTLNNTHLVLIEYSPHHQPQNLLENLYNLNIHGFQPVVAHIERYSWMTYDIACSMKDEGCFLQINASSINQTKTKHLCKKYLKNDMVDVIASDAHFSRKNGYQNVGILNEELKRILY